MKSYDKRSTMASSDDEGFIPDGMKLFENGSDDGEAFYKRVVPQSVVLSSPMGTGTTRCILTPMKKISRAQRNPSSPFNPLCNDEIEGNWSSNASQIVLRVLSPRRAFAKNVADQYQSVVPTLANYLDTRGSLVNEKQSIVSLESIHRIYESTTTEKGHGTCVTRLVGVSKVDVLVVDEVTTLLRNLFGETMHANFRVALNTLLELIKYVDYDSLCSWTDKLLECLTIRCQKCSSTPTTTPNFCRSLAM